MQHRNIATLALALLAVGCGSDNQGPGSSPDGGSEWMGDGSLEQSDAGDTGVSNVDASRDAGAGSGSVMIDGEFAATLSLDVLTCTEASQDEDLWINARSEDYFKQIMVRCSGLASAAGSYPAADAYKGMTDNCTLEILWDRTTYFSFGEGTIVHRLVGGVREFSVEAVRARGYTGNAAGKQIEVSGMFTCPSS
jgi:hypothetical protein